MSSPEKSEEPLKAAVVGVGGMGKHHAKVLSAHPAYRLAAVCDLNAEGVRQCAQEVGAAAYTDLPELLRAARPDVVAICTTNATHAGLTSQVAQAGVRGILCEKPMATCLGDAREMVRACEQAGAILIINHQRRVGPDLVEARRLIDAGVIGDVVEIHGYCAGDILSDGTHLVDSLLWLSGDTDAEWITGHISRDLSSPTWRPKHGPPYSQPGFRYGHAVENGGWGLIQLKDGRRLEIFCGDYQARRAYQEYEVIGTRGRLWRVGDLICPNLFIQDAAGGDHENLFDEKTWHAYPRPLEAGRGQWRVVPTIGGAIGGAMSETYARLARTLRDGTPHPMDGRTALRGFELVMGIYESARLGCRVRLPLTQNLFPLDLMIKEERAL